MRVRNPMGLVVALLLAAVATPAKAQTEYYAIFTNGKKIGHATRLRRAEKDKVTTIESMVLTIARANQAITVRQSETSIEGPGGRPLGFESIQNLGAMVNTAKGTVRPDGKVSVTASSFGQQKTLTLDWPEGALMSEGIRLLGLEKGLAKGTTYSVKAFVPSMMQAVDGRVTVGDKCQVDLLGRVVSLTEVTTVLQTPMGAVSSTGYVDRDLSQLKTVMPVLGMAIEIVACDKAFALSGNDVVDFLAKTVLQSPRPLAGLQDARSATYYLKPTGEKKLTGMIATDSQTVRPGKDGGVIVTVRPAEAPAGVRFPYKGKAAEALAALKPNRYLQSDDKQVIALATKAVGGEKDAAKAARKIEAFVGQYIAEKDLSVGYASAAEVAASRQGDCSEHAVLAAAMCRAVGIPARVVVGYVYVPKLGDHTDVFGGHAWVEACLGRRWVGLDAARGRTGVGHIAQAVGNGEPADFLGLLATMGQFKIEDVKIEK